MESFNREFRVVSPEEISDDPYLMEALKSMLEDQPEDVAKLTDDELQSAINLHGCSNSQCPFNREFLRRGMHLGIYKPDDVTAWPKSEDELKESLANMIYNGQLEDVGGIRAFINESLKRMKRKNA